MPMLTVEKIGGTSMSALKDVIENIICYNRSGNELYNHVFVVSAFSGVTNLLLENKKTKAPGVFHRLANNEDYHNAVDEIITHLKGLNKLFRPLGLDLEAANAFIEQHIAKALSYLERATTMLASGFLNEGVLLAAREILASIGETHSAYVLASILQQRGMPAKFIDLAGFDDRRPLTISERISDAFKDIDLEGCICIATGYD